MHPEIELTIRPVHWSAWHLFKRHHYLSAEISTSTRCFVAFWDGVPVAFTSMKYTTGAKQFWRLSRTVCLPDYQGLGIGGAISEWAARLFAGSGREVRAVLGHPALIAARHRSPNWRMVRAPAALLRSSTRTQGHGPGKSKGFGQTASQTRATASFVWVGPKAPRAEWDLYRATTDGVDRPARRARSK
jgi:hypothetical protein